MTPLIFALVVVLAAAFAFINGFRDVSNSVALAVRTRALTPTVAVLLAAVFNFTGALLSSGFAVAVSQNWVTLPVGDSGLSILVAGLASACIWGLLLWWKGIPSSSTHALVGGLFGAGSASVLVGGNAVGGVDQSLLFQVVLPLALSPVIAFIGAYLLVYPVTWAARYAQPNEINRRFRAAQSITAGAVAFGHGLQDGQRIGAVLLLAVLAAGYTDGGSIPLWVAMLSAVMITVGTLCGGWRISHTMAYRLIRVDPLRGVVAQAFSAALLFIGAIGLHWPISTTHTVTSGVLGAGENQHVSGTHRKLVARILSLWVLTPAATAAGAFVLALALSPLART